MYLPYSCCVVKLFQTEIAGPGFINIHLKHSFISQQLSDLVNKGVRPPNVGTKQRVLVDMSSPNIAKEMHVGHLRSVLRSHTKVVVKGIWNDVSKCRLGIHIHDLKTLLLFSTIAM